MQMDLDTILFIYIITKNKKKYNSVKKVDQKYERFLVKKKK